MWALIQNVPQNRRKDETPTQSSYVELFDTKQKLEGRHSYDFNNNEAHSFHHNRKIYFL